jgi:uncharacterized membrane protein YesL
VQRRHIPQVLAPPDRSRATLSPSWVIRLYEAADEVVWAAKLNALWALFTLAGAVLLGLGPATVAAYTLARRHALGESFPAFSAFLAAYRREFVRGTAVLLPVFGVSVFLVSNYFYFAVEQPSATGSRLVTLAALAVLVTVTAYLLPMAAHYDLRAYAYLPKASLFALTRPASSVLLLFVFTVVAYVSMLYPFLLLVVSVGGWIQLDTWLCLRFFAENEARLRAERIS